MTSIENLKRQLDDVIEKASFRVGEDRAGWLIGPTELAQRLHEVLADAARQAHTPE